MRVAAVNCVHMPIKHNAATTTMTECPHAPIRLAPVLASNDFAMQPIAQTYLVPSRAMANAVLWRFLGVNAGFGYVDAAHGTPAGAVGSTPREHAGAGYAMIDPDMALSIARSPCHALQVVTAEWLQVFAGAWAMDPTAVTLSSFAWPAEVEDQAGGIVLLDTMEDVSAVVGDVLGDMDDVPPFAWTPQVMLMFLADWIGCAMTTHGALNGDTACFQEAAQPFLQFIPALRPAKSKEGPLQALQRRGASLSLPDFVRAMDTIFSARAGVLAVRVSLLQGASSPSVDVLLGSPMGESALFPEAPIDVDPESDWESMTASMPCALLDVAPGDVEALRAGLSIAIVVGKSGVVGPLYSCRGPPAPYLQIVLESAACTMVSVLPGGETSITGRHHLRDLTALRVAAASLFYTQVDAAVAAVVAAFWDRFRQPHWATRQVVEAPALLLSTPVEGKVVHAPADASALHFYFTPTAFHSLIRQLGALVSFLSVFDLKGCDDVVGGPPALALLYDGVPVVVLTKQSQKTYRAAPAHADTKVPSVSTPSLVLPMMWSVVFSREDVLAIAISGDAATAAFRALFTLRMDRMSHGRFQPATDSIGNALCSNTLFSSGQGMTLRSCIVAEVVLQMSTLQQGQALLKALQSSLRYRVCEVRGSDATYVVQKALQDNKFVDVVGFLNLRTGDVEPPRDGGGPSLPVQDIVAWTEPMMCGVVVAANSVAVAASLGVSAVLDSLRLLTTMCTPAIINDFDLQAKVVQDKERALQALSCVDGKK